jgi:hypothetical protein
VYHVRIRRQARPGARWQALAEADAPSELPAVEGAEGDQISVRVGLPPGADVRLFVGSVLVGSSLPGDHVLPFDPDDSDGDGPPPLACRGRLFADWVGQTDLTIESATSSSRSSAATRSTPASA